MMCEMSPSVNFCKTVVFPALSKPNIRIRASALTTEESPLGPVVSLVGFSVPKTNRQLGGPGTKSLKTASLVISSLPPEVCFLEGFWRDYYSASKKQGTCLVLLGC